MLLLFVRQKAPSFQRHHYWIKKIDCISFSRRCPTAYDWLVCHSSLQIHRSTEKIPIVTNARDLFLPENVQYKQKAIHTRRNGQLLQQSLLEPRGALGAQFGISQIDEGPASYRRTWTEHGECPVSGPIVVPGQFKWQIWRAICHDQWARASARQSQMQWQELGAGAWYSFWNCFEKHNWLHMLGRP